MHSFDEWFDRTYPSPQADGTRQTALIAWNAAIHAAQETIHGSWDRLVEQTKYEQAALSRDIAADVQALTRIADTLMR